MSKKVAISAIVIVVAVAIAIGIYQYDASKKEKISSFEECVDEGNLVMESYPRMCRTEDGRLFIEEIKDIVEDDVSFDGVIEVDNPKYNGTVSSPLDIRGKAKGEWMTEELVPFSATAVFEAPLTDNGRVIFEKANPSSLPENQAEYSLPIKFKQNEESMVVEVYFSKDSQSGQQVECDEVFAVKRRVPKTAAPARAAIEELLTGPTENELSEGYFTSLNTGVKIQRLTIADGTAYIDFDESLDENVGGSCRVAAVRSQIAETLKQFQTVDSVVISINGRTEDILQP